MCVLRPQLKPMNSGSKLMGILAVVPAPHRMVPATLTTFLRQLAHRIPAQDVLLPDFPECRMELIDVERVDDGVDRRVAVAQQDGDANALLVLNALGAEQRDAVEDVHWEPADGEEEQHQCQGLDQFQLLAVVLASPGARLAGCYLGTEGKGCLFTQP